MKTLLLLLFPFFAFAQYKDGKALITKLHKQNYGKLCKTMVFKQVTKRYKNDTVFSEQIWTEYLKYPDKLRIDMGDTAKGNYAIFKNDSAYHFKNKKLAGTERDSNSLMLLLGGMYHRPLKEVLTRIQKFGIKLEHICVQKYGDTECYVVGVKQSSETQAQLWVNKKTLQVERFIDYYKGSVMDVRVLERKPACKGETETKLSFYMDGKLMQDEIYFDIKFNEVIQDNTFNTN